MSWFSFTFTRAESINKKYSLITHIPLMHSIRPPLPNIGRCFSVELPWLTTHRSQSSPAAFGNPSRAITQGPSWEQGGPGEHVGVQSSAATVSSPFTPARQSGRHALRSHRTHSLLWEEMRVPVLGCHLLPNLGKSVHLLRCLFSGFFGVWFLFFFVCLFFSIYTVPAWSSYFFQFYFLI